MVLSKEHDVLRQIPYPRLYAPRPVRDELRRQLLFNTGALEFGKQGEKKVIGSVLDLPGLAEEEEKGREKTAEERNEELLQVVCKQLGVLREDFEEKTEAAKERMREAYAKMNTAFAEAAHYIRKELEQPSVDVTVHSKKDVIALLKKTTLYTDANKKSLAPHANYCTLLSVALAVFELQKEESHLLEGELSYLEEILTKPSETNHFQPIFPKGFVGGTEDGMIINIPGIYTSPPVRMTMRDKSRKSQITKYLMLPESNAASALKDALGIRLEIPDERMNDKRVIEEVLIKTLAFLQNYLRASNLRVEDTAFLGKNRRDDLGKRMDHGEIPDPRRIQILSRTNILSGDDFQALKIRGNIKIPRGGIVSSKHGVTPDRSFEIQIVRPGKADEHGLLSHAIYDLKKKITVMTRLYGGCDDTWLRRQIRKISPEEVFATNVITGLQDKSQNFMMTLPKVGKKTVYGAVEVYSRWLRITTEDGSALINDEKIRNDLQHKIGV